MAQPSLAGILLPYPQKYDERFITRSVGHVGITANVERDLRAGSTSDYWVYATIVWDALDQAEYDTVIQAYNATLSGENSGGVVYISPAGEQFTAVIHGDRLGYRVMAYTGIKENGVFQPLYSMTLLLKLE